MDQYRKTPRAQFLAYDEGVYFVTICTDNRAHYFGRIVNGEMQLSQIGAYVNEQLEKADTYCDYAKVLLHVVMPNHIHIIVQCQGNNYINTKYAYRRSYGADTGQRNPNPSLRRNSACERSVSTLSRYITSLKGSVTKFARHINPTFTWQSRYHDRMIRDSQEWNLISNYIISNPANWHNDCFYCT